MRKLRHKKNPVFLNQFKSRLDRRTLDEAVGWVLGVRGQLRAVLGLGVETRTKARGGTRPSGSGGGGTDPALEQCHRVPAGTAMLLAWVTGQGSRLSQVGSLAEGPPSLADQMPRKSWRRGAGCFGSLRCPRSPRVGSDGARGQEAVSGRPGSFFRSTCPWTQCFHPSLAGPGLPT